MNRFALMQDWPLLSIRLDTAAATVESMSADGMTMNGSLPPSSRTLVLTFWPARAPTSRPAGSLPVSVTARTRSSSMMPSMTDEPTSSVWNAPSGKPARVRMSSIASATWGTFEACLSRPTLPAMSAGAAKRSTCQYGKFHGMTASTGPSGW